MGRPPKNNAEWFRHDAIMRNDQKILYLRNKYGFEGYGVWCYILEVLTGSDYFSMEWNKLQQMCYSGDFRIDEQRLVTIINDCVEINLLQLGDGILRCDNLSKRMTGLIEKRENRRTDTAPDREPQKTVSASKTPLSDAEMPHTRLEYIREDNTRADNKSSGNKKSLSNTALRSKKAPAVAVDREREIFDFLEIFFFKGFVDPLAEAHKFRDHYEGVGWVDANNNKITSRVAVARNWVQKTPDPLKKAIPKVFRDTWAKVYERLKLVDPTGAHKALLIKNAVIVGDRLEITMIKADYDYMLKHHGKDISEIWNNNSKYKLTVKRI